ncbi:host cell division inhibitor Icd-like protein [Escherichia coli]
MCWWVKTKNAPLPERSCEQLTCCEKNGSVQGNYINRVAKRHNCRITGKTKATRYGGPSTQATRYPQRMSIANNATFAAGGQCDQCAGLLVGYSCSFDLVFFSHEATNPFHFSLGLGDFFLSKYARLLVQQLAPSHPNCRPNKFCNKMLDHIIVIPCRRTDLAHSEHLFRKLRIYNKYALSYLCASCASSNQFFGSIPRCCNSLRIIRFIQAAKESSPSACCACSIFSRSSGSKRNWNGGLPRLSPLCVDTLITPHVMYLCVVTHYTQEAKKTTPRSAGTHAGRLTTNDNESIEVAMLNHTTHPQGRDSHNLNKYIWRFIALSTAQPRVITIEATSEQEARQQSPTGCVMVFAARIRQEVRHVQ